MAYHILRFLLHSVGIIDRGGKGQANSTWSEEMGRDGEYCWYHATNVRAKFSTYKCFVIGSGFCVSKEITALLEFGVYTVAIIKKRKYWPKGVPGDVIDQYFYYKDVTYMDML